MGKEIIFKMWGSNEIDSVKMGVVNNAGGVIMRCRRRCLQVTTAFAGENLCIIQVESGGQLRLLLRIFTALDRVEKRKLFGRKSRKQEGCKYLRPGAW